MKTICSKIMLFLLIVPSFLIAGNGNPGKYSKEKKIEKTYLVNPDAHLEVSNSFGNIYVTTWNEAKTAIEVFIKVSGNNEAAVNKRIEAIRIDLEALKNRITATTVLDKMGESKSNLSIEINYTIKIPKNGSVKLANKFGNITVDKLLAEANINCRYGKLTANELLGSRNTIEISYSSASTIGYLKEGVLTANYSDFTLNRSDKLNLVNNYTQAKIKEVNVLDFKSKYGGLTIGSADLVKGDGDYTTMVFGQLSKDIALTSDYGQITINGIEAKANNVSIISRYTGITIGHADNYPFNYNFELTYADLTDNSGLDANKTTVKNTTTYTGFYKKSGANTMTIKSTYGNVKIMKM